MINWPDIETVLLDMDGTLLDLHFDNYFWQQHLPERYAQIHSLDSGAAEHHLTSLFDATRGSLNWYCTQYWAQQLSLDIVALKTEITHKIGTLTNAIEFLAALKAAGKNVALATNAHRESFNLKMQYIDLRPYLDHVCSSHDIGTPKEEQGFWQALQRQFPFDPAKTLFIDDNEHILDSAGRFGIKYLLTPRQPDSQCIPRAVLQHNSFKDYRELMPVA